MTKSTDIKNYRKFSAADSYVVGFFYNHNVYMIELDEIAPRFITLERESEKNGGGMSLRLRLRKDYKEQLIRKGAELIGTENLIKDSKYNKGEAFERIVTEKFGQTWEKDNVPFWVAGDISLENKEIQVKFENATITTERGIENARKALRIA